MKPKRGDLYVYPDTGPHPEVFIRVTRVSPKGWVDIRCFTWAVSWAKRMPRGLPPTAVRRDWTQADLDAQEARWEREREATP